MYLRNRHCIQICCDWKHFGRNLGVAETQIGHLEDQLLLKRINCNDVLHELFSFWSGDKGNMATLKVLMDALLKCKLDEISELLEGEYWLVAAKSLKIYFLGKVLELEKVIQDASMETYRMIYCELKNDRYIQPIELLKEDVLPKVEPYYYVPRTLCHMTEISEEIFKVYLKNHVLLVKGIKKHELARLTGFKPVDVTGNQLDEVTVKYMVLECDDDFDQICQKTQNSVHVIELRSGLFFWIKSNKDVDAIYRFIQGKKVYYSEEELLEEFLKIPLPCALSISDSPGMGKSFLLANLAMKVKSMNKSVAIFIIMDEYTERFQHAIDSSTLSVPASIAEYVCSSKMAEIILIEIMKTETIKIDLFLDAYDEISKDKVRVTNTILASTKVLKNFRVFVTTRPHRRKELEKVLNVLSYEILPFNASNQLKFLSRYWVDKYGAEHNERLDNYAKRCLATLQLDMTDTEQDIAGIPLQCRILADVCGQDAKRASKMDSESTSSIKVTSLFDMYKSLVDLKFARLPDYARNRSSIMYWLRGNIKTNYINAHVNQSFSVLFPDWADKFQIYLTGFDKIENDTLYSIGLIENSPHKSLPRFVHRTFAEYLLAEYLVQNIGRHMECVQMLIQIILGDGNDEPQGWNGRGPMLHRLSHSVIAYFVNMHLSVKTKRTSVDELVLNVIPNHRGKFDFEVICKAVATSGSHGFENCFAFVNEILAAEHKNANAKDLVVMRDKYFKLLPHFAVMSSKTFTLIKNVLHITKHLFGTDLSFHVYNSQLDSGFPWTSGSTPLHVAVFYGKYNIVTYLIHEEYRDEIVNSKYLLYTCVNLSYRNSDFTIEDKLSIISMLLEVAKKHSLDWLNEKFNNHIPFLATRVHLKLLQHLHEAGVNINSHVNHETVLYTSSGIHNYNDLMRWATSMGFSMINYPSSSGETLLISYLIRSFFRRFLPVSQEMLALFYEAGANFNAVDKYGDSVLFLALMDLQPGWVISKLIDYGANVNHVNARKRNAAHVILRHNYIPDLSHEVSEKLNLLISRGFNILNQPDSNGLSPFHFMIDHIEVINNPLAMLQVYYPNGTDINAVREDGQSLLIRALKLNVNSAIVSKMIECGANLQHRSQKNENVLHAAAASGTYSNIKLVIDKVDVNEVNNDGFTPLHYLFLKKESVDTNILDLFFEHGANFNLINAHGCSILFLAVEANQSLKIVKKLIEYGADMNNHHPTKGTVLHLAAFNRNSLILEFLMDKIDVNTVDRNGKTPLHSLFLNNELLDPKLLHLFYRAGGNFKAVDNNGSSVLFYAIWKNQNANIIMKLLDFGADLYHLNSVKSNALHVAAEYRNQSVLEYLIDKFDINAEDRGGGTPLHYLVSNENPLELELLEFFREKGADFNANRNGSVLFDAIRGNQNGTIISKIVEYGGDPYYSDSEGNNALHIAAGSGNSSALEVLLTVLKDKIYYANNSGDTALHRVFLLKNKEYHDVLELLLQAGAKFDIKNKNGFTPMIQWIIRGQCCFTTILELQDQLHITNSIGCNALSALIAQESLLQEYLLNSSNQQNEMFTSFFNLLISKGGKIVQRDETPIAWDKISNDIFATLDHIITVNQQMEQFLKQKMELSPVKRLLQLKFSYLVKNANLSVETVLEGMLITRQYHLFQTLCHALNVFLMS